MAILWRPSVRRCPLSIVFKDRKTLKSANRLKPHFMWKATIVDIYGSGYMAKMATLAVAVIILFTG